MLFRVGVESFCWFQVTGEAAEAELKAVLQSQSDKNTNLNDVKDAVCSLSFIKPLFIVILVMANI